MNIALIGKYRVNANKAFTKPCVILSEGPQTTSPLGPRLDRFALTRLGLAPRDGRRHLPSEGLVAEW